MKALRKIGSEHLCGVGICVVYLWEECVMWWAVVKTVGEEGGSREALVPFLRLPMK